MRSLRRRLSYANVAATLAVFVALGGSAYAGTQLKKNSVGPKQLKKNAVITQAIKNEAVTGAKVKKGTLTGTQIDASTIGTVPSAANAQTLGGMSANQIAQGSKLHCPAGTKQAAGMCFDSSKRPAAGFQAAITTCAEADRALPTVGEMAALLLTE